MNTLFEIFWTRPTVRLFYALQSLKKKYYKKSKKIDQNNIFNLQLPNQLPIIKEIP
jgi:hypothetical protein